MAQFTLNATRLDPYRNVKFRVRNNNADVLGVSRACPSRRNRDRAGFVE
jgi:hypothetical protein